MPGLHGPVVVRAAGLVTQLRRPLALMRVMMVRLCREYVNIAHG